MALANNVMNGAHVSAGTAQAINGNNVNLTVTAAGTTRATATALTADVNVVTTATSLQGVSLYSGMPGDSQIVYNATTVPIYVYPSSATIAINQLAAGSGFVLASYTGAEIWTISSTKMLGFLSA